MRVLLAHRRFHPPHRTRRLGLRLPYVAAGFRGERRGDGDAAAVESGVAVGSPPQNKPPGIDAGSHRARCLSGDLGEGDWVKGERACDRATHPVAGCDDPGATGGERAWEFSTSSRERCEARRIDRESLASMLAGKTVAVVGD